MELYPAIDLSGGKVVRLTRGDYNRMDVYSENPSETAADFKSRGAKNLHIVDLDGAKNGNLTNFDTIRRIIDVGLFTQVGGGIRDEERVRRYLDIGVNRVILGTSATDRVFLEHCVSLFGDKIAVGVDTRDGRVAVGGWLETVNLDALDFCKTLYEVGVKTIIFTDISRDGMLKGINLPIYDKISKIFRNDIIASGGVTSAADISALSALKLHGAILGKALYERKLTIEEALPLCSPNA